ncbi:uncharacterized protein At5g39865-like [Panicum virgatum]|uniref:uncharacterized protein At5g39865-like n=1 Tax=Panicum virgatum TaxID=38727 RepID=UPI0019D63B2F|nr:uncharacterized protein At5g39865-like [Panicum virgatum]
MAVPWCIENWSLTFEDCKGVRALLENLAVALQECDMCMDRGLRDQLWAVTGEKAVPPRLFVRGRDVGGAAQVLALHEEGCLVPMLLPLVLALDEKPPAAGGGGKCEACGGLRFLVCDRSSKVFDGGRGGGARGAAGATRTAKGRQGGESREARRGVAGGATGTTAIRNEQM